MHSSWGFDSWISAFKFHSLCLSDHADYYCSCGQKSTLQSTQVFCCCCCCREQKSNFLQLKTKKWFFVLFLETRWKNWKVLKNSIKLASGYRNAERQWASMFTSRLINTEYGTGFYQFLQIFHLKVFLVSPLFGGFMMKMTLLSNSVLLTDAYKPVIYEQIFHKPSPLKHNATMNNRNDI